MKTLTTSLIAFLFLFAINTRAEKYEITRTNSEGFTVAIESVVDNHDDTYSIVLRVANTGRNAFSCKELSQFAVEALPGTYSNVSLYLLAGTMSYASLNEGPNLGTEPFQGFKYTGIKNIGRDKAGTFTVSYTLNGNLQDQRISCNTGSNSWIVRFSVKDFENVRDLNKSNEKNITLKNNTIELRHKDKNILDAEIKVESNLDNDAITSVLQTLAFDNTTSGKKQ
ncbi:MAG: hypothetical protein WCL51_07450 [Bacteroidota bacterium]